MYFTKPQKNKYRNVPTEYAGGKFASNREATKAWELDQLVKTGEILSWEKQKKIELYGENGTRVCNYYVDFAVIKKDGTSELIEIKSPITATPVWKLKWKLLEDKYQDDIKKGLITLTVEY